MANLPTAYASQRFGAKALDFYAASGEVIGADPRARADERRLQDMDGARHTVRLMEAKFDLEPGDQASVLRLQPGPARRSRPVAVVNHTRGGWTRTHPGASALVSRAGIARNVNWALSMALFAAAALAIVWPYLITFLGEIAPAAFAGVPAYDVFALAAAALPGLAGWSIAETTAPLAGLLSQVRPELAGLAPALGYGAAAFAGSVIVFAARSWRLLWAPLFVAALGAGALGFGGGAAALAPALSGLGIAALVFLIGGAWNRISDAARLEARIALLADHLLSNAPEETVTGAEAETETEADPQAEAQPEPAVAPDALVDERTAVAVAASLRSLEGEDGEAAGGAEADTEVSSEASSEVEATQVDEGEASDHGASESDSAEESMAEVLGVSEAGGETEPAAEPAAQHEGDTPAEPTVEPEGADVETTYAEAETNAAPYAEGEAELGEAARPDTPAPAGLDAEEAERLRTDPRYASRAIILPPPPPMPAPSRTAAEGDTPQAEAPRELETAGAPASTAARTLNPGKPLPDNVVPIFAAPPPDKD